MPRLDGLSLGGETQDHAPPDNFQGIISFLFSPTGTDESKVARLGEDSRRSRHDYQQRRQIRTQENDAEYRSYQNECIYVS